MEEIAGARRLDEQSTEGSDSYTGGLTQQREAERRARGQVDIGKLGGGLLAELPRCPDQPAHQAIGPTSLFHLDTLPPWPKRQQLLLG